MRVLLTTDTVGGVWTFTKELTRELLHCGHAVALVSFGRLPSREQSAWVSGMLALHPRTFRYEASSASLEWMENNDSAYSSGEPLLLKVAREFSPDVLHSSQFCFGKLPLDLPRIVTAHSDVLSWSEACKPSGLEPSRWVSRYCELVQDGLEGAHAVIAPTRWMLDALDRNFSLPPDRRAVLNGRSIPGARPRHARHLRAIAAGRLWDEAKNLSMLARLDSPLPILIAGEQRQETDIEVGGLQSSAAALRELGFLSEADLFESFCSSSIYIVASIYEPFGLAPLEAALCGCAVLANDIESLREVWSDAALYFDDGDSLCALLCDLKSSPAELRAARTRSFCRARELTAGRMTTEYIAIYERLLHGSEPSQLVSPGYQGQVAHVS